MISSTIGVAIEFSERSGAFRPIRRPWIRGPAPRSGSRATSRPGRRWPRSASVERTLCDAEPLPRSDRRRLRRRLSDRYGVTPERIALGNGSCDILLAAGEALLEPGAELVYAWPSFSVYPQLEAASGARRSGAARRRTATT